MEWPSNLEWLTIRVELGPSLTFTSASLHVGADRGMLEAYTDAELLD